MNRFPTEAIAQILANDANTSGEWRKVFSAFGLPVGDYNELEKKAKFDGFSSFVFYMGLLEKFQKTGGTVTGVIEALKSLNYVYCAGIIRKKCGTSIPTSTTCDEDEEMEAQASNR